MSTWIALLNGFAVSVFGILLSASFAGVLKKRWGLILCCMAVLPALQGVLYIFWDEQLLWKIYPLVMHLPLVLFLWPLSKKLLWSGVCVLFAYLCCQIRRWLALLVAALISGGPVMQDWAEIVLTVPLIFILLKYVSPSLQKQGEEPRKTQLYYAVVPAVYYIFDYAAVVYTRLLSNGAPVVVEFMPFVCCLTYLVFVMHHFVQSTEQNVLREQHRCLDIQLRQSVREIDALQQSQELARQYRHDLRHHLQYISSCLENGQTVEAQEYISQICRETDGQRVRRYCENETVNLVLSAYAVRGEKAAVSMEIRGALPSKIPVRNSDLCVLLSNAMENALNACDALKKQGSTVSVQFYVRDGKLFLQIVNPCPENVEFSNGVPVSKQEGHGIGTASICAIVKRYGGMVSFTVEQNQFVLRVCLPLDSQKCTDSVD